MICHIQMLESSSCCPGCLVHTYSLCQTQALLVPTLYGRSVTRASCLFCSHSFFFCPCCENVVAMLHACMSETAVNAVLSSVSMCTGPTGTAPSSSSPRSRMATQSSSMAPIPEEVNGDDPHSSQHEPAPAINNDDNITADAATANAAIAAATAAAAITLNKSTQTSLATCTQGTMTDEPDIATIKDSPDMTPRSTAGVLDRSALLSGPTPPHGRHPLAMLTAMYFASSAKFLNWDVWICCFIAHHAT